MSRSIKIGQVTEDRLRRQELLDAICAAFSSRIATRSRHSGQTGDDIEARIQASRILRILPTRARSRPSASIGCVFGLRH